MHSIGFNPRLDMNTSIFQQSGFVNKIGMLSWLNIGIYTKYHTCSILQFWTYVTTISYISPYAVYTNFI